jgi:hypothetical protein
LARHKGYCSRRAKFSRRAIIARKKSYISLFFLMNFSVFFFGMTLSHEKSANGVSKSP